MNPNKVTRNRKEAPKLRNLVLTQIGTHNIVTNMKKRGWWGVNKEQIATAYLVTTHIVCTVAMCQYTTTTRQN